MEGVERPLSQIVQYQLSRLGRQSVLKPIQGGRQRPGKSGDLEIDFVDFALEIFVAPVMSGQQPGLLRADRP